MLIMPSFQYLEIDHGESIIEFVVIYHVFGLAKIIALLDFRYRSKLNVL